MYSRPSPTDNKNILKNIYQDTPGYPHKMYMMHDNAMTPEDIKTVIKHPIVFTR